MTHHQITKLTQKYTQREITTAVKLLSDVLSLSQNISKPPKKSSEPFKAIDIAKEFSAQEIARLKRQKKDHISGKGEYVTAKQVWHDLGI